MFTVRRANASDVLVICDIDRIVLGDIVVDDDAISAVSFKVAQGLSYVAEDANGSVVGMLLAYQNRTSLMFYLSRLAVLEAWRGKGIGRALMAHVSDVRPFIVSVAVDNVPARSLYESCGFVPSDVELEAGYMLMERS